MDPTNPLQVLTQDEAKRMASGSPRQRFDMVIRALGLDRAEAQLKAHQQRMRQARGQQGDLEGVVRKAKQRLAVAEKSWDRYRDM